MSSHERIPTVMMLGRKARLRRSVRFFVKRGGTVLLACSILALFAVAADVLVGLPVPWWAIVAGVASLGLLVSSIWAFASSGSILDALREVDGALGLDDRLSNAMSFSEHDQGDSFVRLAILEGETAGKDANPKRAIAVTFGNRWVFWPALMAVSVALGLLMPRYDLLGSAERELVSLEKTEAQDTAREGVLDAQEALKETLAQETESSAPDEASADALRALDELAQELESGAIDADEAREEAAGVLEEASRAAEERAQDAALAQQATEEILAELDPTDSPPGEQPGAGEDPSQALRESLAKGDLDEAERALEELLRHDELLTPEERAARREALEQLAEDLKQASERAREETERERAEERESLEDWGLDNEQSSNLQDTVDEEEIRESLEEKGFDENSAREQAERLSQNEKERRARERASEQTEQLSEDLREAAKEQDPRESDEKSGDERTSEPESGDAEQQPDNSQEKKPGDEQGESEQNKNEPSEQGDEKQESPGESGSDKNPEMKPDQNGPEKKEQSEREGQKKPGEEQTGSDSKQPQGDEIPEESKGKGEPGQKGEQGRDGDKPGEGDQPGDAKKPGGQQAPSQSDARPGDSQETGEGASDGVGELRKRLEEMRRNAKDADRLRGDAKKLREQAQKMVEEMSPEQRERLARWLESQQREAGAQDPPFATDAVDARAKDESQRVAGEVDNPNWQADRTPGSVSERELIEILRESSRGNEKALEERVVPAKYRNVEEYFRQTIRRVEEQEKKANPPVKTAEDAKSG